MKKTVKKLDDEVRKPAFFEEAITLTGFGKFNYFLILTSGFCLMSVILETTSMMFIIPAAQCDLNLSLSEKGILSSMAFIGTVSTSHFWGFLADTRGRKGVLFLSLLGSAIVTLVCSLVEISWLFIFLRFLNGMLVGGASAIVFAYVGEFHNNIMRPRIVTFVGTFVAIANVYLPGLAWIILPQDWSFTIPGLNIVFRPWRLLLITYCIPSLVSAVGLYLLPESPKFLMTEGKHNEVMDILNRIFRVNTGKPKEKYLVSDILWIENNELTHKKKESMLKMLWTQTVPLFKRPFLSKTAMVCLAHFVTFLSTSGLIMWYPDILNKIAHYSHEITHTDVHLCTAVNFEQHLHLNDTEIISPICMDTVKTEVFLSSLIMGVSSVAVYLTVATFINIVGKKVILIALTIVTTAAGFASQFVYGYTMIQVLLAIFLLGTSIIGIINAIIVDLFPTQIRGMALAISLMCGRIGAMAGSNLIGQILYYLCDYLFYILAVDQIILIVVVVMLPSLNQQAN